MWGLLCCLLWSWSVKPYRDDEYSMCVVFAVSMNNFLTWMIWFSQLPLKGVFQKPSYLKQVELARFINLNTLPFKLIRTIFFSVKSTVRRNQGTSQALRVKRTRVNVCSIIVNLQWRFFFSKLASVLLCVILCDVNTTYQDKERVWIVSLHEDLAYY